MKEEELLAQLECSRTKAALHGNAEWDIASWTEDIRLMEELKKLGVKNVFNGLDIDDQIQERWNLIRIVEHHQTEIMNKNSPESADK